MEVAARDKPRPYGRPEEPGPRQRVSVVEGRAGTSPAPTEDQKSLGQDRGFLLWRGGRGQAPPLRKTRRAWAKTEGFCCGGAGGDEPRPYGRPEEPGPRQRVSVVEGRAGTSPAPTEDRSASSGGGAGGDEPPGACFRPSVRDGRARQPSSDATSRKVAALLSTVDRLAP